MGKGGTYIDKELTIELTSDDIFKWLDSSAPNEIPAIELVSMIYGLIERASERKISVYDYLSSLRVIEFLSECSPQVYNFIMEHVKR